jgi:hypothetical protein
MDMRFMKSWNKEIKKMKDGKVGVPFEYSYSYTHSPAFLKIRFKISYRTVQGIERGLSDYMRIEEMHFTQIRRRIQKIKSSVDNLNLDGDKHITLIVDASGLTITKKGEITQNRNG